MKKIILISLMLALLFPAAARSQQQNFGQGGGGAGLAFVAAAPALCTPGVTASVQLSVSPFSVLVCTATNTWTALAIGSVTIANGTLDGLAYYAATTTLNSTIPAFSNVGKYSCGYTITVSMLGVPPDCPQVGLAARSDTALSGSPIQSFDVAFGDVVYSGASATAVTVPAPFLTLKNPNAVFATDNALGSGAITFTPTTLTVNGGATLVQNQFQHCQWFVNPALSTDWFANCVDRAGYINGLTFAQNMASPGPIGATTPAVGKFTTTQSTVSGCLNALGVVCVDQMAGADWGAKVAACITQLQGIWGGGTCDARGLGGTQTMASPLTITAGITLLMAPMTLTEAAAAIITCNQGCVMRGTKGPSSGGGYATYITQANGANNAQLILATTAADYWHWGEISTVQLNGNKANNTTTDCLKIYQPGETSVVRDMQIQNCPGDGLHVDGTGATGGGFQNISIFGSGNCGLDITTASFEYAFYNLSGDDDQKWICISGSGTFNFYGAKMETHTAGKNEPVFQIAGTANVRVTVVGLGMSNTVSINDFFRVNSGNQANLVMINSGASGGYPTNFINDTVLTITKPLSDFNGRTMAIYSQNGGGLDSLPLFENGLEINGTTSGTFKELVPAVAGTPTVTWGSGTGTPAVTASAPLTITAATGNITCATCNTSAGVITNNVLPKGSGGAQGLTNSLATDDGTQLVYTGTGGIEAPIFESTGTTAGFSALTQGTTSAAVDPCNVANTKCYQAPTALTYNLETLAPATAQGMFGVVGNAAATTEMYSGDAGHSAVVSWSTATSLGSTSLCSTANCPVGTYRISAYIDVTTACTTTGSYLIDIIYTDDTTVSKTTLIPLEGTGSTFATGVLVPISTTDYGQATFILRSTGVASINYSTTAAACGSGGPGVGKLYLTVEPIQ